MEEQNYYVENLETGKLNVFTTKEFYDQLEPEKKKIFKNNCLWSRPQNCWISKGKAVNCGYLKRLFNDMNFENRGTVGERISFEEKVDREKARATDRAERSDSRAEKAEQKSDELYTRAKEMASVIPFGQPILVGHHSENRDRNYRNRIHNTFGKSFKEQEKAGYYKDKADAARHTAEGKKYSNPVYLLKKIRECQKDIRICERRLKGKFYSHSKEQPVTEAEKKFYEGRIAEERDKLQFYEKCMIAVDPEYGNQLESQKKKNGGNKLSK